MTVQKFIQYNSLDLNGQILNDEHKLELNILENSGNYLVHKDILRHQISRKQSTSSSHGAAVRPCTDLCNFKILTTVKTASYLKSTKLY